MQTFPPGGVLRRPPTDPRRPSAAPRSIEQDLDEILATKQTAVGRVAPAERARLRMAGFSDAEIDAELGGGVQSERTAARVAPDPVRARKADRWDALVAGGMDPDVATAAVNREFSQRTPRSASTLAPGEIDSLWNEYQNSKGTTNPSRERELMRGDPFADLIPQTPARPTIRRPAAESSAMRGPGKAPARASADAGYGTGLLRNAAQGATFGFADELEAGARAAVGPRTYRDIRDEVRRRTAQFAEQNPGTALAANIAGGMLTGGATFAAAKGTGTAARVASQLAPQLGATAGTVARIGAATRAGAVGGALLGAGNAEGMDDLAEKTGVGLLTGGVVGGAVGGAAEGVRVARNLVSRVGQGEKTAGAIRQAIRADAPETSAARRVLVRAGQLGMSVDDLAARANMADGPDVLGEILGAKGVRDLRTARAFGYQAPDLIDETLTTRARNDVGQLRQTVRQELGEPLDDVALRANKRTEAQQTAAPLYDAALDGVSLQDPRFVGWMDRPVMRRAWEKARELAANAGDELPSASAVLRNATGRAEDVADSVVGGVATRRAGRADAAEDLAMLNKSELRAARRGGALETMTAADLEAERMYLAQQYGDDAARAVLVQSPDYAEYQSLREIGAIEDARGIMERMGFSDPNDFAAATRDGQAAAKRLASQRARLDAVERELTRRGEVGPSRAVPGRGAVSLPDEHAAPSLPSLTGKQTQYLKLALDDEITKLEGMSGGTSTTRYRQLVAARDDVDNLLYEFANRGEDGASMWGKAQQAYAKPLQEADAFAEGVRGGRSIQAPDVPRFLEGPAAEWRARGVANTIQDDLARLGDGSAGALRDPAPTLMGSDAARARLEVAAGGDRAKVGRIEDAARNVSRRLKTRGVVLGGSQTLEKFADAAEAGLDPATALQAMRSPTGAALQWIGQQGSALRRNVTGQDMDALSRFLLAGGPKQMTRAQAMERLKALEPAIVRLMTRQALLRGTIGARAGDAVTR